MTASSESAQQQPDAASSLRSGVALYPRGYDRLPETQQRRETFSFKSSAAFCAQIQQRAEHVSAVGEQADGDLQLTRQQDESPGHLRRILLSRGCAILSTMVVLVVVGVTAQQLIERHDFNAVRMEGTGLRSVMPLEQQSEADDTATSANKLRYHTERHRKHKRQATAKARCRLSLSPSSCAGSYHCRRLLWSDCACVVWRDLSALRLLLDALSPETGAAAARPRQHEILRTRTAQQQRAADAMPLHPPSSCALRSGGTAGWLLSQPRRHLR